jgi:phosphoglycerol transferase
MLALFFIVGSLVYLIGSNSVVSLSSVMYVLNFGFDGVSKNTAQMFLTYCSTFSIVYSTFGLLILLFLKSEIIIKYYDNSTRIMKLKIPVKKFSFIAVTCAAFLMFFYYAYKLDWISQYITFAENQNVPSEFIAQTYIAPESANINFPGEKRNLICIYAESMEASYTSKRLGGVEDIDLIPELSLLARLHTSFSHNELLGGALFYKDGFFLNGVMGTTPGIVAVTAGLPFKSELGIVFAGEVTETLPNAVTFGDILAQHGYNQAFVLGSDATFGGRRKYFENHGNFAIKDWLSAPQDGIVPEGYYDGWWGIEDYKMFEYAQKTALELAAQDAPFNLTVLTVDTHYPGGNVCPLCGNDFKESYKNAISCSDRQISSFIKWVQAQDFYDDTTVIILGDHITMDSYGDKIHENNPQYLRTTYNVVINSPAIALNTRNRRFTSFDWLPTIFTAIGADYDGSRLGLGADLFSEEQTIIEKFGWEYVTSELDKHSAFYDALDGKP